MEEFDCLGTLTSLTVESVRLENTGDTPQEEQRCFLAKLFYDSSGRLIRKEENGKTTHYHLNEDGLCEKEVEAGEDGQLLKETRCRCSVDRKLEEESGQERKTFHYNNAGRLAYTTSYINGSPESIISRGYDDQGNLTQLEIRDPEGHLLRSCRYKRNDRGLVTEEVIVNQENILLEHNEYEYQVFCRGNWLKRVRYSRSGRNERMPVDLLYRSIAYPAPEADSEPSVQTPEPEQTPEMEQAPPEESSRDSEPRRLFFDNGEYRGRVNSEGQPDGRGEFRGGDGSLSRGTFRNGRMEGPGELRTAEGRCYRGPFINGLPEGRGECRWPDGSRYAGMFRRGEMHGLGVFTWPDGSRFTGQFDHNRNTDQGLLEEGAPAERENQ